MAASMTPPVAELAFDAVMRKKGQDKHTWRHAALNDKWTDSASQGENIEETSGAQYYGVPADQVAMLLTRFDIHHYLGPSYTELMTLGTFHVRAQQNDISAEHPKQMAEFTENFIAATVNPRQSAGQVPQVLLEGLPYRELSRFLATVRKRAKCGSVQVFRAFLTPDSDGLYTASNVLHAPSQLTKHEGNRGCLRRAFLMEQAFQTGVQHQARKLVVQEFHLGRGAQRYPHTNSAIGHPGQTN